ncbi:MAG: hypothetical protein R2911_43800 [Caldilineaceae bacterium]
MMTNEERICAYDVDTDFLDISGMEYIEMLYNRSEIAKIEDELSPAQKGRLALADRRLIRDAHLFYTAIQSIANLKRWREQENVSPDHWWWYLDVLAAAPIVPEVIQELSPA